MNSAGQQLHRYLKRESQVLEQALAEAALRPRGWAVHHVRTASRRLRTALGMVKGAHGNRIDGLRRRLRDLADQCGDERELEVAARDAHRFRIGIRGLKRRQAQAQARIGKTVGKKKFLALPAELRTLAEYFGRQPRGVRLNWAKARRKLRSVRDNPAVRRARKRYLRLAREKLPRTLAAAENSLRHCGR